MSDDSSAASLNRGSAPVVVIEPPLPPLDVQILKAERAVLERDRQVRDSLIAVATQARDQGSKWAVGIAIAGGALVVVWLMTRHRIAPVAATVGPKVRRRGNLAIARSAALLWPLLPWSVKSRASDLLVRSVFKAVPRWLGNRSAKARDERPPSRD